MTAGEESTSPSSPDASPSARVTKTATNHIIPPFARYLIPLVVFLSLSLPKINQGEWNVDTGWYAAIAHQAWSNAASGNPESLWTLRAVGGRDGVPYFNKPPLAFWIHGFMLWISGISLWAARLPSVLAGSLTIMILVYAASKTCSPRVAIVAGVVLAATIEFVRHTHAVSLDLWHSLFLFGVLAAFLVFMSHQTTKREFPHADSVDFHDRDNTLAPSQTSSETKSRTPQNTYALLCPSLASGICLGLALMTKPLLALIALPILASLGLALRIRRTLTFLTISLSLALLIAAPWHIAMTIQHGDTFTMQYFGKEVADRAAGDSSNFNRAAVSPLYYLQELATSGWPWLATVILAFIAIARGQSLSRSRVVPITLAAWILAWLVLLSIFPDKRPRYMLMLYAPAAWLSAQWLCIIAPQAIQRATASTIRWAAPIAIIAGIALSLAPITMHRAQSGSWNRFFAFLRDHPDTELWQGGFIGSRAARVYLLTGKWPTPTHDTAGRRVPDRSPPIGSFIAYHTRDGLSPGANETSVFHDGEITITRLDSNPWKPTFAAQDNK